VSSNANLENLGCGNLGRVRRLIMLVHFAESTVKEHVGWMVPDLIPQSATRQRSGTRIVSAVNTTAVPTSVFISAASGFRAGSDQAATTADVILQLPR